MPVFGPASFTSDNRCYDGGLPVTKALPFTKASIVRRILAAKAAGLHVIGVKPDGTLIVADEPIDVASFVPPYDDNTPDPEVWPKRHATNGGGA